MGARASAGRREWVERLAAVWSGAIYFAASMRMVFTDDNCFGYAVVNGLSVRMDEVLRETKPEFQCGRAVAQSPFDTGPQGQMIVMQ
jgi:hypothetical protein